MEYRTDLAFESAELLPKTKQLPKEDVIRTRETLEGFSVLTIDVLTARGAKALKKPIGKYFSLDLKALMRREEDSFPRAVHAVSALLSRLLDVPEDGLILVAGIGNRYVSPDALGPKAAENIVVTRHLIDAVPEYFSVYRPVASVAPGVLGSTGIESGEMIKGVVEKIRPAAIIAVDALAAGRLSRLVNTIQISNAGITPGSGIGNFRFALNRETLGVPVIAVGVPTVVDGKNLAIAIEEELEHPQKSEALQDLHTPVIVTTNNIDRQISDVSRVIGYGINQALNPSLTIEDMDLFLS